MEKRRGPGADEEILSEGGTAIQGCLTYSATSHFDATPGSVVSSVTNEYLLAAVFQECIHRWYNDVPLKLEQVL